VRSLHLNERSARTWTNLGVLYLVNSDHELAHQAFGRAQSTDPEYAHAWLGEGLIALLTGDSKEALSHYTHAVEISDSSSLIVKRQYTTSVFDHLLSGTSSHAPEDLSRLVQPIFALRQLAFQAPDLHPSNHLSALFSERAADHSSAISNLTRLAEELEIDYEEPESPTTLFHFALAKSDLARSHLAAQDFAQAIENSTTALDLSADDDETTSGLTTEARRNLRLSAHLTAGLAEYKTGDFDAAIAMFRSALQDSDSDPDVIGLLVQVLWAKGGKQERIVAKEQLFEAVEKYPNHVGSVLLLGAIAVLEEDQTAMEAVREDLRDLRTREDLSSAEKERIERVLGAIAEINATDDNDDGQEEEGVQMFREVQRGIMLAPEKSMTWTKMAECTESEFPAHTALLTAKRAVPPFGGMGAEELADAFAGTGVVADAQRSIALAPWKACGWEALSDVLAT